jgi:hypothetical protein
MKLPEFLEKMENQRGRATELDLLILIDLYLKYFGPYQTPDDMDKKWFIKMYDKLKNVTDFNIGYTTCRVCNQELPNYDFYNSNNRTCRSCCRDRLNSFLFREGEQYCKYCSIHKPYSEFPVSKMAVNGYSNKCFECRK